MSNPEQLKRLAAGVKSWNAWRHGCPEPVDLKQARLSGVRLNHADFSHANPRGASFGEANLHSAYLAGAKLEGAHFEGADLTGVQWEAARSLQGSRGAQASAHGWGHTGDTELGGQGG